MTVREAVRRWLSRGGAVEDPEELVEIAITPLAAGPMAVESLCSKGFHASGAPTYNIITDVASDYRILVPRKESVAATTCLDELR
ncbi:MAG: hypothetical protein HZB15_04545 [Actinobacteria bacterium]|nr:hypothetical protein [Actinomycetota bacterium]